MLRRAALLVLLTAACQPSVHDVIPSGGEADRMVVDTERVCARPSGSAYSKVSLSTSSWSDLARRADNADADALHTIARLMRANRDRFRDSVCTKDMVETLEHAN